MGADQLGNELLLDRPAGGARAPDSDTPARREVEDHVTQRLTDLYPIWLPERLRS
jgi:hypothetical protein